MKFVVNKIILAIVPKSEESNETRYIVGVPSKFISYSVRSQTGQIPPGAVLVTATPRLPELTCPPFLHTPPS